MNTKIIDNRGKIANTTFKDIKVGEFFQDTDKDYWHPSDLICMKVSETFAIRYIKNECGNECEAVALENWGSLTDTPIIPLKATVTIEKEEV